MPHFKDYISQYLDEVHEFILQVTLKKYEKKQFVMIIRNISQKLYHFRAAHSDKDQYPCTLAQSRYIPLFSKKLMLGVNAMRNNILKIVFGKFPIRKNEDLNFFFPCAVATLHLCLK